VTADQLLLWRHGRTASNAGGRFQGQLDVPLDEVGQVQIKDAAECLAVKIGVTPCRIVSSDLVRAHDTALALASRLDLPVVTDPALREIFVGDWEGLLRAEAAALDAETLAAWQSGADVRPGGGERRSEAAARAAQAISSHAEDQDGGILVVASHGAALRGAILQLIGFPHWSNGVLAPLRNAHWAQLDRRGDRWVLTAYNLCPSQAVVAPEG
jgi:broad specificity phosphatase PhoE